MAHNSPNQSSTQSFGGASSSTRSFGPCLSFMDFPLEIRNTIYSMSLIFPTPLIAWADTFLGGTWYAHQPGIQFPPEDLRLIDWTSYFKFARPVERCMRSLSLVCRGVHEEIMEVFWTHNNFRFTGNWTWDPVLRWLIGIGPAKRGYITRLELELGPPEYVLQLSEPLGKRVPLPTSQKRNTGTVNPRNKPLVLSIPKKSLVSDTEEIIIDNPDALAGPVVDISPDIEVGLKLLSRKGKWSKVTIVMLLDPHVVPGLDLPPDGSMDLSNVIEGCLASNARNGRKQIEVLWNCMEQEEILRGNKHCLEEKSWEIISEKRQLHESYEL